MIKSVYSKIDDMQEKTECYYINFLPETMMSDRFSQWEEYFENVHLKDFAVKVSNVILKLMCYYEAEIYLTEFPKSMRGHKYEKFVDTNFRNLPLKKIAEVVKFIIEDGFASFNICFEEEKFLISASGYYNISFFNLKEAHVDLISKLVVQENLFFLKSRPLSES